MIENDYLLLNMQIKNLNSYLYLLLNKDRFDVESIFQRKRYILLIYKE